MLPSPAPSDAIFAAIADPWRRAILQRLAQGPVTVGELTDAFPISQPAISRHMRLLEEAGLILRDRDAQRRPARLAPAGLDALGDWVNALRGSLATRFDQLEDVLARMGEEEDKT